MVKAIYAFFSLAIFSLAFSMPITSASTDSTHIPSQSETLNQISQNFEKLINSEAKSSIETLSLLGGLTLAAYETRINIRLIPEDFTPAFIDTFENLNQKVWTSAELYQRIDAIPADNLTSADIHTINRAKTLFKRYGFQPESGDIHMLATGSGNLRKILQYPNPELHQKAQRVTEFNDELQQLIDDMFTTMYQANGVGLAATQIGVHQQVVVMDVSIAQNQPIVFINPKITPIGDATLAFPQGCLSVKDTMDVVTRPKKVRIEAQDRYGNTFVIEDDKLMAVCIQHEIDHLNGILFIQHLSKEKQKSIATRLGHQCDVSMQTDSKTTPNKPKFIGSH
jgi:peptide deformylase